MFQQTFLGASITNFNTNLGLGSNSSSMSINLVSDDINVRGKSNDKEGLVNGAREGYSYDSDASINLFPIDLWKDINDRYGGGITTIGKLKELLYDRGDYFWAPPVGSPVFFSYFDNKRWYDFQDPSNGGNVTVNRQYLRDRWDASILNFGGILKSVQKQWDVSSGVTYSVELQDPKSILEGTQVVLSDSISPTAPPDQDMKLFFDMGGIQRKLNRGFAGAYNVINPFGYYELRHDKTQTIFPDDFPFSYNRLDYANRNESGIPWMQDANISRRPGWEAHVRSLYDYNHLPGVQWALESMLGGWNETYFERGEPFGGGLFYGQANSLMYHNTPGVALSDDSGLPFAPFSVDELGETGTHAYRFAVDLSELRKLHEINNPTYLTAKLDINGNRKMYWGGIIPNDFQLQGQSMSLLQLIQQVCDMAGADFFVTLLPGCFVNHSNDNTPTNPVYTGNRLLDISHNYYSGVIKINVMQRNREINVGVISQAVHDATENHKGPWAADSIDCLVLVEEDCLGVKGSRSRCEWNSQIKKCQSKGGVTQADVGREFTDAVSNIVMYGGARTRMIGVTPVGVAKKRKEIYIDQDNSQWNHCWNLGYTECIGHTSTVGGFSDCTWDDYHKNCTGLGEQDPYFIEFLPNIELDGVTLHGNPIDESVDSSYGFNNDEYINWQWHRHEAVGYGGVNSEATDILPHDRNALNSVSSVGSIYNCTYSYPDPNRKIATSDSGASNVDACLFYTHSGRCSDKNYITQSSCTGVGGIWILDPFKDPKGLCGTTTCKFNKCDLGGGNIVAVDNERGCDELGGDYTAGYTQAVANEDECARLGPHKGPLRYPPFVYIEPTSPNVSEAECKLLITLDPTRIFVPNHWNRGDGQIDLYPMWGFDKYSGIAESGFCSDTKFVTEEDCLAGKSTWSNPNGLVVTESEGSPILGGFNDDDPYRDFDEGDGIYSVFSYYNKYQGSCYSWGVNEEWGPIWDELPADMKGRINAVGSAFPTTDALDVARCLDMSAHDETQWISYCSNSQATGSGMGEPFVPKMTIFTKFHTHSCNRCTVGAGLEGGEGEGAGAPATKELCIAKKGKWETVFKESSDGKLRTKEDCEAAEPKGIWELQFKDPLTKIEPIFDVHKSIVDTDDGYGSCTIRDFPDEAQNIVSLAHNIGYCKDSRYDTPNDCQGEVTAGVSAGNYRPGSVADPDNPTIYGSPSFRGKWVSKIKQNKAKNLTADPASFMYARPSTATIPIDLGSLGYGYGPTEGADYAPDYYYATVTELRHAAVSFSSWKNYLFKFDPHLLCAMEWSDCPLADSSPSNQILGQVVLPANIANAHTSPAAALGTGWNQAEKQKLQQSQIYTIIADIAQNHYGKTYLMPLPMAPRLGYRCSDGSSLVSTICEEAGHEWGAHGFPNEWVRKLDDRGLSVEDRWEISSSAWVGDDAALDFMSDYPAIRNKSLRKHVRYPQHANFWTSEGNCESFATFPRLETKRLEKVTVDLDFTQIDPESVFTTPTYTAGNLGGKTQGKAFVKASVDPKVHWLRSKPTWEAQHGREYWGCYDAEGSKLGKHAWRKSCLDNGGRWVPKSVQGTFYQPYALVNIGTEVSYTENDSLKIPSDFVGCYDPKRTKIGANQYRGGRALGVCKDRQYIEESEMSMVKDMDYVKDHRSYINDGYGCHYDICKFSKIEHTDNNGVTTRKTILKRFYLNKGKPIQDKETCLDRLLVPCINIKCDGVSQNVCPVWSPAEVCSVMTGPIADGGGKWVVMDDGNCEDEQLNQDNIIKGDIATRTESTNQYLGFSLRLDPVQTISIPLTRSESTASLNASAKNVMGNIFFGEANAMGKTINPAQMIDARYKPWYAGVPQQSNRFTWGPWGQTSNFGKAEVTFDQSYNPGPYGGIDNMNRAALAKINNSTKAGAQLTNESGSVTISGLPEYKMGSPVQLYMVSGFSDINTPAIGPYVTDISLNIGTDGVSTTYRMQTQRKFGDTQSIYEDKMLKAERDRLVHNKRIADQEKHTRRPDPSSNKKK